MPRSEQGIISKTWARILFLAYVVFMLSITLLIFHANHPAANLVPFQSIVHDVTVGTRREFIVNFLGNIIAFAPFGFLYRRARGKPGPTWEPVAFCAGFSGLIELLQFVSRRRVADIDDVILNTLGGALGVLVGLSFDWIRQRFGSSATTIE